MNPLVTALVAGALAVAGCAAPPPPEDPPPDRPPPTSSRPATTPATTPAPEEYAFTLPKGDRSVSLNEAIAYDDLHQGKCDKVQLYLDGDPSQQDSSPARVGFLSPRNVLLWQAGIHLCRGDTDAARPFFEAAEQRYGWAGTGEFHACELYRSAGSAIRQRPRNDFTCQSGQPPPWPPDGPYGRDDPRTSEDEGNASPSPS